MDVILGIFTVIDLIVSCVSLGYDLVKDQKNKHTHKNDRPSLTS